MSRISTSPSSSVLLLSSIICGALLLPPIADAYLHTPATPAVTATRTVYARPPFSYAPRSHISTRPEYRQRRLTTKLEASDEAPTRMNPFRKAIHKFRARPGTYLLIPCIAAVVGWVTNALAVQMIFYPIRFRGIPIYVRDEVPLGLLGWQGIVPCKTRKMSETMVHMVTTQLLSVEQVFGRLNPRKMAALLAPEVPKLGKGVLNDVLPFPWLSNLPTMVFDGLSVDQQAILKLYNREFLTNLSASLQRNIQSIFNLRDCVVEQMLADRRLLGQLFRVCGQKELDFLTNSGLWFGFLLGLIQMVVALFWENPWTLSIGGGIVGLATNWLALKWIFQPVNPTQFGPFLLQGQFLRRQKEVAREFSRFFANTILTSEKVWHSVLTDPVTTPAFHQLFAEHFQTFLGKVTRGLQVSLEPEVIAVATAKAIAQLPNHVGVLHNYIDNTLGLERSLRVSMERMTNEQFERVLHPIFEEDELTLILAGAVLGFLAGLVQQGLETGSIQLPDFKSLGGKLWQSIKSFSRRLKNIGSRIRRLVVRGISAKHDTDNDTIDGSSSGG